jgi:uncharacterized CHY-type Zn-finger protein
MLIHEHNLVPSTIKDMICLRCITCGTLYCQLCGNSLDADTTHNHQLDKFRDKQMACGRVIRVAHF